MSIRHPRTSKTALALAAAASLLPLTEALAAACTWNTTTGNWSTGANWTNCTGSNGNPAGTPGGADTANIASTGTVAVTTGQAINTLNNAGVVNVGNGITLSFDARTTGASFTGGGQVVLGGPSSRLNVEGGTGVTVGAGSRIRGAGQIGLAVVQSGSGSFTSAGTVSADSNGQLLTLLAPGNNGFYVNNGLMEARDGGTLDLAAAVSQGAAGQIRAENGSFVQINGTRLTGGLLDSIGTGRIRAANSFNNELSGVTLAGVVDLAAAPSQLRITNGLTFNNGRIDIGDSVLYFDNRTVGTQSLGGTGSLNLAGGALRMEGTGQTATGSNVTVRGFGTVGQATSLSGNHTWINNGRVSADVSGQTLNLVPVANGGAPIQNNGVLEALNGGRLLLSTSVSAAPGSEMRAAAGSVIEMNGVQVTGTINTTGTGSFRASNIFANVLSGVTLNGTMDLASQASQLRVSEGLVLNGSIDIGGSVVYLDNRSTSTQAISGAGTMKLAGGALRMEGSGQTTTGADITIRGHGTIGQATVQSGDHTWVHNGRVSADVSGQTLNLVPVANGGLPIQNNGVLEAINGGRLLLSTGITGATGSELRAGTGSIIEMNGVRVTGTVNTTGTGSFRASNTFANVLSGVTLNGAMDLASQASQLRVSEGLVLNGSIDIGSSVVYLDNRFTATQGVTGTGTLKLADGALRMEGAGQTTTGSTISIVGYGTVGQATSQSGAHAWINNGLVSANVSGRTLNLVPPANGDVPIQNNGTFRAAGGGTLLLSASVSNGGGSSYDVDAASRIVMNGVTLSGRVAQTGAGAIDVSNNFNNALTASTLSGRVNVGTGDASSLRLTDSLTMSGGATVTVGSTGVLSFDNRNTAAQSVSGTGQIVLNSGTLRFEGGTDTTWASGITVRGSGNIGQATVQSANQTLFNHGTIIADSGSLNIIPIANGGALQGTGTLRVDGGALSLGTGRTTNQGTLDIRGTGTLALGANNLVLSADYTNAQAGNGNAFNRRAGVTGAGQILAGGDAQQGITGANVTGGNTPNATLTIGNVRVGSTTFNYQVANAGSTGPTLRGAIQTTVNGANLNDGRLSGSGVTAGNYNAGAPGGSSGNLGVTFNAANAGALAPLSGQVLNLRSNFENIADQKLNIVMASGAAAYNAALGNAVNPVSVANQRVGGSNTAMVSISNATAAGAFSEDLNARVSSVVGQATATGTLSGRVAGTSNTGTGGINVGVSTGTAGAKSGTVIVAYETAGAVNGVSNGLGTASAGTQAVTVNGNVYQQAAGQIVSAPLNFGTVQVGQTISRDLQIRNTASGPTGFVEDLNASFGAKSGTGTSLFSGTGSLSGITAGSTSNAGNGTMTVSVNTAAAGTISGSIAVNYASAGAVGGVSNGLGTLAVGSENFGVAGTIQAQANVINQASPLLNTPTVNLGAVRVGAAAPTALVSLTNQATSTPQAALNASIASNGAPVGAGGSFSGLLPGATSNALQVSLNTGTAGNFTGANAGSATISLVSDASNVGNCAPNCQLNLAPQTVTVSGKVYTPAVGQAGTPVVDFGIVRVGDTVSARNISVSNTAVVSALNDTMLASLAGVSGPFMPGAPATNVAAGTSAQISVGLSTASAGVFNQAGSVAFVSRNADMADASAGPNAGVQVKAQVNHLANADFDLLAGLGQLSDLGNGTYVLNLGSLALGSNGHWLLQLDNEVTGPADALRGAFDLGGADDFALGGFGAVGELEAGEAQGGLAVDFQATRLGSFEDEVAFRGFSVNASDPDGVAQGRRLLIRATVFDPNGGGGTVPEPGTLALLLLAALGAVKARARAARH